MTDQLVRVVIEAFRHVSWLELLDIAKPPGMDGRSFLPILRGEKQAGRDHVFTHVNTVSSGKAFPGALTRRTSSQATVP